MANESAPPAGLDEYISSLESPTSASGSTAPAGIDDYIQDLHSEKYGTLGQMAKTAAEGVAEGIAGPLAPMAETSLGIATPEDIRGRAEENPGVKGTGEAVGLVAPALVSGGTSLAAKVGIRGAAEALPAISAASKLTQGEMLSNVGSLGAKALGVAGGEGYVAKAVDYGVKAAFEGALYDSGKQVTDMYLAEPGTAADFSIAHMGLTAALSGVFGGAFGAAANAIAKKPMQSLVSSADTAAVEAGDLGALLKADPAIPDAKKTGLLEALNIGKKKANAKEIESIAQELGLPATPGMTLDSPLVKMQVDRLSHSPSTFSGDRIGKQLDSAYNTAESVLLDSTASANKMSSAELGDAVKEGLTTKIRTAYAPQKEAFEELSALHQSVPLESDAVEGLAKSLGEIKEVKLSPNTSEGKLVRQVLDLAKNAQTAEDLTTIRNIADLKPSGVGADPLGWLKGKIRDELGELQEDSIRRYSKSFPRNDEAGAMFASKVEQADAAREAYKPYIKKVSQLSEWMGKGKIRGTEDALHFLNEKLSPSDVSRRLFSSSKDPEFLKFFSKEFPEEFKMVRDYQRQAIRDEASLNGEFSAKKFFKKFNDLEKEVQANLYSKEEINKIRKLETYYKEAFPPNFNPSGTAHMLSLADASNAKGLLFANARDYGIEKMIQMAEKGSEIHNAQALGKATSQGWKMASDSAKAIFNASKQIPAKVIPIAAHRETLDRLVAESVKNPDRLYAINDNNPIHEYNEPFAATSATAVQYLNSIKPKDDPSAPLDSRRPANATEKAAYHRALDIAQQPLLTMKYIKDGTLTSKDVTTIKAIYPNLYNKLSEQIMQEMINAKTKKQTIPYATKQSLSLFLGQTLDSTLTPQSIRSAQPHSDATATSRAVL
jgi:hypothetical protein